MLVPHITDVILCHPASLMYCVSSSSAKVRDYLRGSANRAPVFPSAFPEWCSQLRRKNKKGRQEERPLKFFRQHYFFERSRTASFTLPAAL